MIYFMQAATDGKFVKKGWIKIGHSERPSARITMVGYDYKCSVLILGVMDGTRNEEKALHDRFNSSRVYYEWFNPDQCLLDFIEAESRPWNGIDERPLIPQEKSIPYENRPDGMGKVIALNLIRLGYVEHSVRVADIARLITEKTGKPMSRQRVSAIMRAPHIEQGTLEMIAKAVGVKPAELLRPKEPTP